MPQMRIYIATQLACLQCPSSITHTTHTPYHIPATTHRTFHSTSPALPSVRCMATANGSSGPRAGAKLLVVSSPDSPELSVLKQLPPSVAVLGVGKTLEVGCCSFCAPCCSCWWW